MSRDESKDDAERGEMERPSKLSDAEFQAETKRKYDYDPLSGTRKVEPAPTKFETIEMLQYLAMNKRDPDFGIPADVIDAIAIALAGEGAWLKAQKGLRKGNEKKRSEADRRREKVRAAATILRAENPGISEGRLEKILAEKFSCGVRTIRRYLAED
jgi:hypothetical protein